MTEESSAELDARTSPPLAENPAENNDPLLTALVNFLVPIILLYGIFLLTGLFDQGFFSVIYTTLVLLAGLLLFSTKYSYKRLLSYVSFRFIYVAFFLCFLACTVSVMLLITDFLTI